MPNVVTLKRSSGRSVEIMRTIPEGQHSAYVVTEEFTRVVQRAYELGRSDEAEDIERSISDTLSTQRKLRRADEQS